MAKRAFRDLPFALLHADASDREQCGPGSPLPTLFSTRDFSLIQPPWRPGEPPPGNMHVVPKAARRALLIGQSLFLAPR